MTGNICKISMQFLLLAMKVLSFQWKKSSFEISQCISKHCNVCYYCIHYITRDCCTHFSEKIKTNSLFCFLPVPVGQDISLTPSLPQIVSA